MNVVLWVFQVLLAFVFLSHGRILISPSSPMPERMARRVRYIYEIQPGFRRTIGVAELLAAMGLILPGPVGILPWLTPLAASGLVIVMIGALIFHLTRREFPNLILNSILLALSAFVASQRWFVLPR